MERVNIHDAKTNLSRLIERVIQGEEIIISKAGKPVALLSAYSQSSTKRKLGLMKGKIQLGKDFDAPLPDSVIAEFEGG
jgi:prevent-host-death family protein